MGQMSKDRVRFEMCPRYFTEHNSKSGMHKDVAVEVLNKAFGPPRGNRTSWRCAMKQHPHGFEIVCRPSQFARFIVYRNEMGNCINGISDLRPKIVEPLERKLLSDTIADETGLHGDDVRDVMSLLNARDRQVEGTGDGVYDVSGNPHECC